MLFNKFCFYRFWHFIIFGFSLFILFMGFYFLMNDKLIFLDWEILSLNSSSILMTFLIDWMSLLFMGSVLFISSMVIFYSTSYMSQDIYNIRFLCLVLLFILSMMFLIVSPNLVSILLGWDGLGLVSYALVIYFNNWKSNNAGMLTVLTNRIGDVCILISISWFFNTGGWNFFFYTSYYYDWYFWVCFLLVVGSFTKSAQIPFSSWLPAAMAAPTPVSALVHSSTLVTAGVYLLIRWSDFILSMDTSWFLLISCLTMFMAGLGANFEFDLKKIIALSTLSQLGMMMSILFVGFPMLSYLHLLSHAFFKALLFLCAGLIIHCMNDTQDIRYMGHLANYLPYTCSCFCISSLSLCGFPFLTGFYSKDMILEFSSLSSFYGIIYYLFYISVGLTACYSFRLIYYCISGNNGLFPYRGYGEDLIYMYSMLMLTLLSVSVGSLLVWSIIPFSSLILFPLVDKILPLIFVFIGIWLGLEFNLFAYGAMLWGLGCPLLLSFMGSMWFMPYFSSSFISRNFFYLSSYYYNFMDQSWGESLVSLSWSRSLINLSNFNSFIHFNNIKIFLLSFMLTLTFMLMIN